MSSGMGIFSKASFFASTKYGDGQDIDLVDTNFWEKDLQIEAPHESIDEGVMKFFLEKRSRNQVKIYDPYDEFAEVFPELAVLLLSVGTALNEIIRSF